MGKSPLILAALANAAVPSLGLSQVKPLSADGAGNFDTAVVTSNSGEHYVVRIPNNAAAGAEQEVELRALKALSLAKSNLPFDITRPIGETADASGARVIVFSYVYGNKVEITQVSPNSSLAQSIARATAAIHNLPISIVEDAHLAEYSPADSVRQRVAELDRAAQTGKVPAVLLNRWEQAMEDVSLFKYQPTVVHGALNGDTVLEQDGDVSGILAWSTLKIADPAEDLSWVLASGNPELIDSVLLAYQLNRSVADSQLRARATLYAEFEVARWLLHGVSKKDQDIIDDATAMLEGLAAEADAGQLTPLGVVAAAMIAQPIIEEAFVFEEKLPFETEDYEFTAQPADDKTKPIELPPATENELF